MRKEEWYVARTQSRFEKKIQAKVQRLGITTYLPTHKVKRQWHDRTKYVEVPLFAGYVFIKTTEQEIPLLKSIKGIASFISFSGKLAVIREEEINTIKRLLESKNEIGIRTQPVLQGQRIQVVSGPLLGLEGVVENEKNKNQIIICIEGLRQKIFINVPMSCLRLADQMSVSLH